MLSDENKSKIIKTGLYRASLDKSLMVWDWEDPYWCKNWTFKVSELSLNEQDKSKRIYMVDTCFSNKYIELTDENFDKFKLIFDFNDVCEERHPEEYEDIDVYRCIAVDSGGIGLAKDYRKKQAKRSKEKMRNILISEIARLETKLSWKKQELINFEKLDIL